MASLSTGVARDGDSGERGEDDWPPAKGASGEAVDAAEHFAGGDDDDDDAEAAPPAAATAAEEEPGGGAAAACVAVPRSAPCRYRRELLVER